MPFKSKAQMRWMFAAEDRGEVPEGTAERWAHHTSDTKSLPEHVDGKDKKDKKKGKKKAAGDDLYQFMPADVQFERRQQAISRLSAMGKGASVVKTAAIDSDDSTASSDSHDGGKIGKMGSAAENTVIHTQHDLSRDSVGNCGHSKLAVDPFTLNNLTNQLNSFAEPKMPTVMPQSWQGRPSDTGDPIRGASNIFGHSLFRNRGLGSTITGPGTGASGPGLPGGVNLGREVVAGDKSAGWDPTGGSMLTGGLLGAGIGGVVGAARSLGGKARQPITASLASVLAGRNVPPAIMDKLKEPAALGELSDEEIAQLEAMGLDYNKLAPTGRTDLGTLARNMGTTAIPFGLGGVAAGGLSGLLRAIGKAAEDENSSQEQRVKHAEAPWYSTAAGAARDMLGNLDPTAQSAIGGGVLGAGAGGLFGAAQGIGGAQREPINETTAALLLERGVSPMLIAKLKEPDVQGELNEDEIAQLVELGIDYDKIAPKGSYLGNMAGKSLMGAGIGGLGGAALGAGASEGIKALVGSGMGQAAKQQGQKLPGVLGNIGGNAAETASNVAWDNMPRSRQWDIVGKAVPTAPHKLLDKGLGFLQGKAGHDLLKAAAAMQPLKPTSGVYKAPQLAPMAPRPSGPPMGPGKLPLSKSTMGGPPGPMPSPVSTPNKPMLGKPMPPPKMPAPAPAPAPTMAPRPPMKLAPPTGTMGPATASPTYAGPSAQTPAAPPPIQAPSAQAPPRGPSAPKQYGSMAEWQAGSPAYSQRASQALSVLPSWAHEGLALNPETQSQYSSAVSAAAPWANASPAERGQMMTQHMMANPALQAGMSAAKGVGQAAMSNPTLQTLGVVPTPPKQPEMSPLESMGEWGQLSGGLPKQPKQEGPTPTESMGEWGKLKGGLPQRDLNSPLGAQQEWEDLKGGPASPGQKAWDYARSVVSPGKDALTGLAGSAKSLAGSLGGAARQIASRLGSAGSPSAPSKPAEPQTAQATPPEAPVAPSGQDGMTLSQSMGEWDKLKGGLPEPNPEALSTQEKQLKRYKHMLESGTTLSGKPLRPQRKDWLSKEVSRLENPDLYASEKPKPIADRLAAAEGRGDTSVANWLRAKGQGEGALANWRAGTQGEAQHQYAQSHSPRTPLTDKDFPQLARSRGLRSPV